MARMARRTAGTDVDLALASAHAFHVRIAEMAGSARGAKIVAKLLDEVTRLHYLMPNVRAHVASTRTGEIEMHRKILEAIEKGDQKVASASMKEDLSATHRTLVEVFGVPMKAARA